jgi:hypothetical protein
MIWGRFHVQPAEVAQTVPSRNPLLLFEPRPASPWQFAVRELAPQWQRHIERLQQDARPIRVRN